MVTVRHCVSAVCVHVPPEVLFLKMFLVSSFLPPCSLFLLLLFMAGSHYISHHCDFKLTGFLPQLPQF